MSDSQVELQQPQDISQVIALLAEHKGRAKLIAGGTDLIVDLKNEQTWPGMLISLAGVEGLDAIEERSGELVIGAMVTPNAILESPLVQERLPALADAARTMASYQVRNLATLGGNLCSASPSADLPPALVAAGAWAVIQNQQGEIRIALHDFFTGPRETALEEGTVLTHVVVPPLPSRTGIAYHPFKLRGANALAVAAAAVRLTLDKKGSIDEAVVVLGAVAPKPMAAVKAGKLLQGEQPSPELFDKAAAQASQESKPIADVRGTVAHRKALIEVLTRRALNQALARAQEGGGR
ncbi:MAG: xanthine dehydrogenase family protein subunit M [Anaerolineales bacterium]|jgi:carbon-monoxide dehydrogenase medium subunit